MEGQRHHAFWSAFDHQVDGVRHKENPPRDGVEKLPVYRKEYAPVVLVFGLRVADLQSEISYRFGENSPAPEPVYGGHPRVVPAGDEFLFDQGPQKSFRDGGTLEVES